MINYLTDFTDVALNRYAVYIDLFCSGEVPVGAVANLLSWNGGLIERELKYHNVQFKTNTLGKYIMPFIASATFK